MAGERVGFSGLCRRAAAGPGQSGHPNLALGRRVSPGHVRSEAGGGERLLRAVQNAHRNQRAGNQNLRAAAAAGETGGQVFPHPQHDPRQQCPRNRIVHGPDRPASRRTRRLSVRRRRGVAVQGLRRRIPGTHSALHRVNPAAGAVLRSGLSGVALQTVRHGRRSGQNAVCGGRRCRSRHFRAAAEGPS